MRLYDQQTETGPPDEVIYWHGSSYVIELIFAADGTIARIALLPRRYCTATAGLLYPLPLSFLLLK